MFRRFALPFLASVVVLGSGFMAEAKTYSSAKQAALRQGAYRITRNTPVRTALGVVDRRRVTSRALTATAAGNPRFLVQTRQHLNGKPVTTQVIVRQLKSGLWKPYSGKRINYARATKNSKLYGSAKTAALRQGAYRFSRNNTVRNALGVMDRKRVTSKALGNTAAGNPQFLVQTRQFLNGKPVTTKVIVRQLNSGDWKPYRGKTINFAK